MPPRPQSRSTLPTNLWLKLAACSVRRWGCGGAPLRAVRHMGAASCSSSVVPASSARHQRQPKLRGACELSRM